MNVKHFFQDLLKKLQKDKIKKFSINFNFISCKEKLPSESGSYYVYTSYGEIQSLEYSKEYNLWNASDDYINAALDDVVIYWSENVNNDINDEFNDKDNDKNNNNINNKNNKVIMTPGELASKLLLAYYSGKLNEDEDSLKEISIMNNTDVIKNISDKGQLIDWN